MSRTGNILRRSSQALALLLFVANAVGQSARGEKRALRKSAPIYLRVDETRLVDRALVERIRCERGVLIVRPLGRSALVYCGLRPRSLPQVLLSGEAGERPTF